jgi:VWFA-related protein
MPAQSNVIKTAIFKGVCGALTLCLPFSLSAQTNQDRAQGDVIRVFTDLVQTDVMVFDKSGRIVNGLKREDFQLKIDGKPKAIEFFEEVTAGSDEEAQLAAARGNQTTNTKPRARVVPLDRGRNVLFYVDDLHLDLRGQIATKKLITRFIEEEMGQNDEAAITSTSNQIGFLQQLTDNKTVLKAALEKINLRAYAVRDFESPTMTEYQAILVENNDIDVNEYFIDEVIRRNPGISREMAADLVKGRARRILQMASAITVNTLAGLESLVRRVDKLPGRKLVFFVSDGFFLDQRNSDAMVRLQRITSAAARNGVVIYSMDARGLVSNFADASSDPAFDLSGRMQRSNLGELSASQDIMYSLAAETGGRAVFNTNDLRPGLADALKETSFYYLLAWKPDRETSGTARFRRLEVTVASRPDLTVRVRRGFFDVEPQPVVAKRSDKKATKQKSSGNEETKKPAAQQKTSTEATFDKQLQQALSSPYPERQLPVSLALTYLYTPDKGDTLSASLEVPAEFLTFSVAGGQAKAVLDVLGSFFNEQGHRGDTFSGKINVTVTEEELSRGYNRDVGYTYPISLKPGLYQVRVAVRDQKSGLVGSKWEWIEIPDLSKGKLAMSSLLLGERSESNLAPASTHVENVPDSVGLNISHRFHRESYLRFLVFVYNAAKSSVDNKPDVAIQVQVVRDKQPVITTTLKTIPTEGLADLTRVPYAAELPLRDLTVGSYRLQVTLIDRAAKLSASQTTRFEVY